MMKKFIFATFLFCFFTHSSRAAIAVVQAANNQVTSATASTINTSGNMVATTAGNLLYISCYEGVNNTSTLAITDSASQTWIQAGGYVSADTSSNQAGFYKPNSASVTSITGTWSGSLSATIPCIMYEISGAATGNPFDANTSNPASSSNTASGNTLNSGTLSTNNTNDILLYAVGIGGNAGTNWIADTGHGYSFPTNSNTGSTGRLGIESKIVSSPQNGVTTFITTSNAQLHRTGIFVAFADTNQPAQMNINFGIGGKAAVGGKTVIGK